MSGLLEPFSEGLIDDDAALVRYNSPEKKLMETLLRKHHLLRLLREGLYAEAEKERYLGKRTPTITNQKETTMCLRIAFREGPEL